MIYDSQRAISTLNTLIETCKDGEKGFRAAAEGVSNNPDVRLLLHALAQERARLAAELHAEVLRIGGHPEEGGSVCGAFRRGWMNIKAVVMGGDESAILSECEASEDVAVKAYDDALNAALGPQQRDIIARQPAEVKEAHIKIHLLRDARRSASRAAR